MRPTSPLPWWVFPRRFNMDSDIPSSQEFGLQAAPSFGMRLGPPMCSPCRLQPTQCRVGTLNYAVCHSLEFLTSLPIPHFPSPSSISMMDADRGGGRVSLMHPHRVRWSELVRCWYFSHPYISKPPWSWSGPIGLSERSCVISRKTATEARPQVLRLNDWEQIGRGTDNAAHDQVSLRRPPWSPDPPPSPIDILWFSGHLNIPMAPVAFPHHPSAAVR